jgi:hypothetical protein
VTGSLYGELVARGVRAVSDMPPPAAPPLRRHAGKVRAAAPARTKPAMKLEARGSTSKSRAAGRPARRAQRIPWPEPHRKKLARCSLRQRAVRVGQARCWSPSKRPQAPMEAPEARLWSAGRSGSGLRRAPPEAPEARWWWAAQEAARGARHWRRQSALVVARPESGLRRFWRRQRRASCRPGRGSAPRLRAELTRAPRRPCARAR